MTVCVQVGRHAVIHSFGKRLEPHVAHCRGNADKQEISGVPPKKFRLRGQSNAKSTSGRDLVGFAPSFQTRSPVSFRTAHARGRWLPAPEAPYDFLLPFPKSFLPFPRALCALRHWQRWFKGGQISPLSLPSTTMCVKSINRGMSICKTLGLTLLLWVEMISAGDVGESLIRIPYRIVEITNQRLLN